MGPVVTFHVERTLVKQKRAINATAQMLNHPDGFLLLHFKEQVPTDFDLPPLVSDTTLFLPDPTAPGYRLGIEADSPATLKRVANALLALARSQESNSNDDSGDDSDRGE